MRTREGNKEQAILDAAVKVFAENGYHAAKIHKIAEVAGIATGSVYSYFENKQKIILAIFEDVWKTLCFQIVNVEADKEIPIIQKFDAMIDMILDLFTENRDLALVFVNEENLLMRDCPGEFTPYFEQFVKIGEEIVRQGIEQGKFHAGIKIDILRTYLFGGIRSLLLAWATEPKRYPLSHVREELKSFIKHGIQY
jgi:TetR/AcrR family fatty acid metabolism transcriptional regulator